MTRDGSRFIGGMNLDRPLGGLRRANATIPLAVMTIAMDEVRIEPIPLLSRVLPGIRLSRDQVESVYRSTGVLTPGVTVKARAGGVHYFWTPRGRRIVSELEQLGYPSAPPKRPRLWRLLGWSRKPIT